MIYFGPEGNSAAFYDQGGQSTWQAMQWISGLGLTCYGYAYGRGFPVGDAALEKIGQQARQYNLHLSVEGLYYINLANEDFTREMHYFDESLAVVKGLGAERLAFHPGSVGDMTREQAMATAVKNLKTVVDHVKGSGLDVLLCPQIADKVHDIGTVDEIIELCAVDEIVYPGMAFGHLQAITDGSLRDETDYAAVLDKVKNGCGEEKYRHMHIDFTHVRYSPAGELDHLTFADRTWGPFFQPLADLLAERNLEPWCLCTSKDTQAEDAVAMKKMYERALAALGK